MKQLTTIALTPATLAGDRARVHAHSAFAGTTVWNVFTTAPYAHQRPSGAPPG